MKTKFFKYNKKFFVLLVLFLVNKTILWAQESNSYFLMNFENKIVSQPTDKFVKNNLSITNISPYQLQLQFNFETPNGYNFISNNNQLINLESGANIYIPITLIKNVSALSGVSKFKINVTLPSLSKKFEYNFEILNKASNKLRIYQEQKEIVLSQRNKVAPFILKFKNYGNATQNLKMEIQNERISLHRTYKFKLDPNKDTVISLLHPYSTFYFNTLKSDLIKTTIYDDSSFVSYDFVVTKAKSGLVGHKHAYNTMPISIESGAYLANNQFSGYWALAGDLNLGKLGYLSASYRGKEYGPNNIILSNQWNLQYKINGLKMEFGQQSLTDYKVISGFSEKITYSNNDKFSIGAMYIQGNDYDFVSRNSVAAALETSLKLPKNKLWSSKLLYQKNDSIKESAIIVLNKINLIDKNLVKLNVQIGGSVEKSEIQNQVLQGFSAEYEASIRKNKISLMSIGQYNSDSYAGIYKGWRNTSNNIDYQLTPKFSVGSYLNYNYTQQSFFLDSFYMQNKFLHNFLNYGASFNWSLKKISVSLSAGSTSMKSNEDLQKYPKFKTFSSSIGWALTKFVRLNFNSNVNINNEKIEGSKRPIYYNNTASLIAKKGGVNLYYNLAPARNPKSDLPNLMDGRKGIGFSPYFNFSFLQNRIFCRLQYNYMINNMASTGKNISQGFVGNLQFTDNNLGLNFQLFGNYLITKNSPASSMINLVIRKNLNIPLPGKRKYFDMGIQIFEDKNSNGKQDENEKIIPNLSVEINNQEFNTVAKKGLQFKNIDTGVYKIDFMGTNDPNGLIPVQGFLQTIELKKNTVKKIPFTKGLQIKGKINIILDEFGQSTLSSNALRVTALDSAGNKFYTLSNQNGDFTINVPKGMYVVSLNPDAFDNYFRPVQMSYNVDFTESKEPQWVEFTIKQKNREIKKTKSSF